MGIGLSILLMAVGALLTFAGPDRWHQINLDTAGIVLMVVGAVGLIFTGWLLRPMDEPYVADDRVVIHDPDEPEPQVIRRRRRRF